MKKNNLTSWLVFCVVSIIYCFPVFDNLSYWGQMDWDQFTYWNAVPREVILKYHQFPLWNPFTNGGNVLLAHPQTPFLSPLYIIVFILGPIIGLKLLIIIHLFIGLYGMFLLAKYMKLGVGASYLTSFVFMLNSMFALHLTEGHTEWLAMAFMPWVFLYYLRALEDPKKVLGAIFFLGLIVLNGSIDVLSVFFAYLLIYTFFKLCQLRQATPLKILIKILIGTFLLCAIKLIPMIEFLHQYPRLTNELSGTSFFSLYKMLLGREQAFLDVLTLSGAVTYKMGLNFGWHEYGAYIGIIPLALFFCGAIRYFREHWPILMTGIISLFIALGSKSPINLWDILHNFPVYDSISVPSRFILGFIFSVSILCGFGFVFIERLISEILTKKNILWVRCGLFLVVLFVLIDLWLVNTPIFKSAFRILPLEYVQNSEFRQRYDQVNFHAKEVINSYEYDTSHSSMYPIFLSNSGVLDAYEVVQIKKGDVKIASNPEYNDEVYLNESNGDVRIKYFSPNKIIVNTDMERADILILNQNYYRGWKVKQEGRVELAKSYKGLIATQISPGQHEVVFYYLPRSFLLGFLITVGYILRTSLFYRKK